MRGGVVVLLPLLSRAFSVAIPYAVHNGYHHGLRSTSEFLYKRPVLSSAKRLRRETYYPYLTILSPLESNLFLHAYLVTLKYI